MRCSLTSGIYDSESRCRSYHAVSGARYPARNTPTLIVCQDEDDVRALGCLRGQGGQRGQEGVSGEPHGYLTSWVWGGWLQKPRGVQQLIAVTHRQRARQSAVGDFQGINERELRSEVVLRDEDDTAVWVRTAEI